MTVFCRAKFPANAGLLQVFDDRLGAGANMKFLVDVTEVRAHGGDADLEFVRDFLVGKTFGEER